MLTLTTSACSLAPPAGVALGVMIPADELAAHSEPMAVERDIGWMPNAGVRFGPWSAEGLKTHAAQSSRGATVEVRRSVQFNVLHAGTAQSSVRLSGLSRYTLDDPLGWLPDVRVNGAPVRMLRVIRGVFRDASVAELLYSGEVSIADEAQRWQIFWRPAAPQDSHGQILGMLTGPSGEVWSVHQRLANPVASGATPMAQRMLRYVALELVDDGRVIASLSSGPTQHVWIKLDLPVQQRLVAAAWASSVLLSPSLN